MLCSYNATDEAMIWEQIDLPVNITQEPVGFTMKNTHSISVRPSKGLKIHTIQKNALALGWTRISIIILCPGEVCAERYCIQTCPECHWDDAFNWTPVSMVLKSDRVQTSQCLAAAFMHINPVACKCISFFLFYFHNWFKVQHSASKKWVSEATGHL